ncbi:MAG: AAA family ATPase [Candidatus Hydrothermia bacterium]|jgi:MoxR-like ATPase|nr:MoxR family ATPase [Candidatus Hydrothermia bacterium]
MIEKINKLKSEISKIIVNYEDVINKILICMFSKGHVLLVGVPGLAKTLMVKTLSQALDLKFSRIQFTPDLMPMDILGTEIIQEGPNGRFFQFVKGPIFANVILADEINRTPPKTQSALLEAMQERRVTVLGKTYELEEPFFVLATQNPIEQEGTYPLAEAQIDRFMMEIILNYPTFENEIEIVKRTTIEQNYEVQKVLNKDDILTIQMKVREIPVGDHVVKYAINLVRKTRPSETDLEIVKKYVQFGAGPRASQFLIIGAKAKAFIEGKDFATTEDVKYIFFDVLRHRIILNFLAEADNITSEIILKEIIEKTPIKS